MATPGLTPTVKRLAVVTVLGTFMSILDTTIVNVALDTLARDLDATLDDVQWVATAYLLALAATIPVTAWASRRVGAKRLYVTSIVFFTAGSALCALAWNVESLVMFRVLQGIGGGMIMPVGQTIMARTAGPQNMGRVMAITGVPILLAPVLGPVVGGVLIEQLAWQWIFLVNVPIGVVAVVLCRTMMPAQPKEEAGRLDVAGLALLATGLPLAIFGLTEWGTRGALLDAVVLLPLLGGLALTGLFVGHALRVPAPLLDLRLFADKGFATAAGTTFAMGVVLFGALLILPLYYQQVRGEDAITTGLLLAPQGIGAAMIMPLTGRLTDRHGGGPVALIGVAIIAVTLVPFVFINESTPYWLLAFSLVVRGVGLGAALMPAFSAAYARLRPDQIGDASPQLIVLQRVGGAVGTSVLTVVLTRELDGAQGLAAASGAFGTTFAWALGACLLGMVPAVLLWRAEREIRAAAAEEGPPAPGHAEQLEAVA